jgi:hypothetical protein
MYYLYYIEQPFLFYDRCSLIKRLCYRRLKFIDIFPKNKEVLVGYGFELCEKILAIDINVKVCFMSYVEINREGLREIYPSLSLGCFIRKPVSIDYLLKRIKSELD